MTRARFTLTDTFQQVAAAKCIITIGQGGKFYSFNETASDTAALTDSFNRNSQIMQSEATATWAKSAQGGTIIVDEV